MNEFSIEMKELELVSLKAIHECTTIMDLYTIGDVDYFTESQGKSNIIEKIKESAKKFFLKLAETIESVMSKITKKDIKKQKEIIASNPNLKNTKVEIADYDKMYKLYDDTMDKVGKAKDKTAIDKIMDTFSKHKKKILIATTAVSTLYILDRINAYKYKRRAEKKFNNPRMYMNISDSADTSDARISNILKGDPGYHRDAESDNEKYYDVNSFQFDIDNAASRHNQSYKNNPNSFMGEKTKLLYNLAVEYGKLEGTELKDLKKNLDNALKSGNEEDIKKAKRDYKNKQHHISDTYRYNTYMNAIKGDDPEAKKKRAKIAAKHYDVLLQRAKNNNMN